MLCILSFPYSSPSTLDILANHNSILKNIAHQNELGNDPMMSPDLEARVCNVKLLEDNLFQVHSMQCNGRGI